MATHEQMQDVRSACEKVKTSAAALAEAIAENERASVPEHTYDERPGAKSNVRSANDELAEHVPAILAMMNELAELRAQRSGEAPIPLDERPWCWRKPTSETCEGPFPTREEAIHDARHGWACAGEIEVGRCTPPVIVLDLVTLMERAEESLCDDGWDVTLLPREGAEDALGDWCERYLYAKGEPWAIEDAETLPAVESEDDDE